MSNIKDKKIVDEMVLQTESDIVKDELLNESVKNEIVSLREQIENAKSELYLMRMTPLDNRAKSFSSDKKKYKINVRKAKSKVVFLLSKYKNKERFI